MPHNLVGGSGEYAAEWRARGYSASDGGHPPVNTRCETLRTAQLVLLIVVGTSALVREGASQPREPSAANLTRRLLGPADVSHFWMRGTFTCGSLLAEAAEKRALAGALANMGSSAIPEVERAIDSIESSAKASEVNWNFAWLLYVYAKVRGSAVLPRLQEMMSNGNLEGMHYAIDASIALSLGLTSYIDNSLVRGQPICRPLGPRDALDQFILPWMRDERQLFERMLAHDAAVALDSLLSRTSWTEMRSELWPKEAGHSIAIGYKFDIPTPASDPPETLSGANDDKFATLPANLEIETIFKDQRGVDCGRWRIRFLRNDSAAPYLVDNSDLGDVLHVISSCVASDRPVSKHAPNR